MCADHGVAGWEHGASAVLAFQGMLEGRKPQAPLDHDWISIDLQIKLIQSFA
jgi:hypothetical protein